jgi:hypothetical protein
VTNELVQQPPLPPLPPIPPEVAIITGGGPPVAAIIAVVAIVVAGIVLYPLVRALARRLESPQVTEATQAELEQLRIRVADLEQVHQRVAELEERVEFSERMLTQRSPEALRRGDGR